MAEGFHPDSILGGVEDAKRRLGGWDKNPKKPRAKKEKAPRKENILDVYARANAYGKGEEAPKFTFSAPSSRPEKQGLKEQIDSLRKQLFGKNPPPLSSSVEPSVQANEYGMSERPPAPESAPATLETPEKETRQTLREKIQKLREQLLGKKVVGERREPFLETRSMHATEADMQNYRRAVPEEQEVIEDVKGDLAILHGYPRDPMVPGDRREEKKRRVSPSVATPEAVQEKKVAPSTKEERGDAVTEALERELQQQEEASRKRGKEKIATLSEREAGKEAPAPETPRVESPVTEPRTPEAVHPESAQESEAGVKSPRMNKALAEYYTKNKFAQVWERTKNAASAAAEKIRQNPLEQMAERAITKMAYRMPYFSPIWVREYRYKLHDEASMKVGVKMRAWDTVLGHLEEQLKENHELVERNKQAGESFATPSYLRRMARQEADILAKIEKGKRERDGVALRLEKINNFKTQNENEIKDIAARIADKITVRTTPDQITFDSLRKERDAKVAKIEAEGKGFTEYRDTKMAELSAFEREVEAMPNGAEKSLAQESLRTTRREMTAELKKRAKLLASLRKERTSLDKNITTRQFRLGKWQNLSNEFARSSNRSRTYDKPNRKVLETNRVTPPMSTEGQNPVQ